MSKRGYVATAGGFCVAISSVATTNETNLKQDAVTSTTSAIKSQIPLTQSAATPSVKKLA